MESISQEALKFMSHRDQFDKEVSVREGGWAGSEVCDLYSADTQRGGDKTQGDSSHIP